MRLQKVVSIIVGITFLSMLCASCRMDTVSQPEQSSAEEKIQADDLAQINNESSKSDMDLLFNDPGRLHNEILAEMGKDGIFITGEKLGEKEYVAKIVESSNAVYRNMHVDYEVTEDDIRMVLQCFDSWRERGVFDVYAPIEDRKIENVYHVLDYLACEREEWDPREIERVRLAIQELEGIDPSNCSRETIQRITGCYRSDAADSESYRALDILEDSFSFWSTLKEETVAIDSLRLVSDESVDVPELGVDWYSICILLWDAVGALLCWPLGPVSVLCAVIASSAFIFAASRE
jgi:hypothetical protein